MKKYAQIIKERVHHVLECEELPPFHSSIMMVEITNINPEPQEGWDYIDGIFSPRDSKKEAKEKLKKLDKETGHVKVLELLVDKNILAEPDLEEEDLAEVNKRKALKAEL